jgi:peptide/nickel transport system substrate-binding protein
MDLKTTINRRTILKGGVALGFAGLPFAAPEFAFAQAGRSVTVRIDRDIQNMDPASRIGVVEGNILRATMRGLTQFAPGSFEVVLDAAETMTQVDETTIDFTLRPGIMFHQGYGEMTAEDVKFSFERFNAPAEGEDPPTYSADWAALDRVEVTGTHSGRLILKNAAPAIWLIALSDISGCIVSKRAFEALGSERMKTTVVGSGPYEMTAWAPNSSITLTADPAYTGDAPMFPEIVLLPIQEPQTAQLAFRSDEVHFTSLDNPAAARALAATPGTEIIQRDSINYVWIGMNVEKAPLDDLRVRQAIRLALNVDEILLAGWDGAVGRANALMAPGLLGHWDAAPVYQPDLDAARALLAESGHGGGLALRLTLLNTPVFQTAGLVAQAQLAQVGITLELEVLDGGTYWSMGEGEAGENLELSIQRFGGKADPSFQTQWFVADQIGSWNWQRWSSPEFDRMNAVANSTADEAVRAQTYVQMQELMDQSSAYIWLTHEVNLFATKDWLAPATLPNGDDWQYSHFKPA